MATVGASKHTSYEMNTSCPSRWTINIPKQGPTPSPTVLILPMIQYCVNAFMNLFLVRIYQKQREYEIVACIP